jgi:hypothetical protein
VRLGSILIWICSLAALYILPTAISMPKPLWTAEVLEQEFAPIRDPLAAMMIQRDRPGVVFLDDDRLIVYEVDSTGKLSSRTSPDISSAFRLHASIFSADAGLLESTRDWATHAHYSSVQSTAEGILVRTGDKLTLLSKEFQEIDSFTLPDFDRCMLSVSATQKTVLVNCLSNKLKISHFDVLDGTSLRVKYSWSESPPLYRGYSVTDTGIVDSDISRPVLIFSQFASREWNRIAKSTRNCPNLPLIVADSWFFNTCKDVSLNTHLTLSLSSMDGQVLMTDEFEKDQRLSGERAISRNEHVVAFSLNTIKVQRKILTESSEQRVATYVALYDLRLMKRILTINVSPLPEKDYDFALSPNGSKLAVLDDRRVSVYSVPVN